MRLTSIEDLKDDANKALILEAEWNLSQQFEDHLDDDEEEEGHVRPPGVHASELNSCKRMVVYTIYGTEKVRRVPKDMKKRFKVGHALHAMLQSEFHAMVKKKGGLITFSDEVKTAQTALGRQLDIQSSCDGVFDVFRRGAGGHLVPMMRIGLEIKSEAPKPWADLKVPRPKHVEQAHVYMACLDLPLMWFLYWNKGDQNYTPMKHPWLTVFDHGIWRKLEGRAKECLKAAEDQVLPDREEGQHCNWCSYAHTCNPPSVRKPPGSNHHIRPLTGKR